MISPANVRQIREQMIGAIELPRDPVLRDAALAMPTWQDVADRILEVYQDVLR